jgi:nucleoside-diphosphate-sugar epimerase
MGLCLVTGGAGFIGRWLVSGLLQRGKRVIVLDNLSGGCRANLAEFSGRPGFEGLIRGDVRNPGTLYELFFRGLECCFHLASVTDPRKSLEEPQETFDCVVGGTMRLLEMCREYDSRMVFVSTSRISDGGSAISEEHPPGAGSPYAACKLAAENLCLGYHRAYRLPVVVVRPFDIYGPFQRREGEGGVVARLQRRAMAGESLVLGGDRKQTRDFVYVEDCAALIAEAGLSRRCEGEVLNAASGRGVPLGELAEMIAGDRVATREPEHPSGEPSEMVGDGSKAAALTGWKPSVDLREGLERTRAWMEAHPTACTSEKGCPATEKRGTE